MRKTRAKELRKGAAKITKLTGRTQEDVYKAMKKIFKKANGRGY